MQRPSHTTKRSRKLTIRPSRYSRFITARNRNITKLCRPSMFVEDIASGMNIVDIGIMIGMNTVEIGTMIGMAVIRDDFPCCVQS